MYIYINIYTYIYMYIWRDHLERPRNGHSWAAILLHHRGLDWLMQQRALHHGGLYAGRTGTRIAAGGVATRWHDGVRYAERVSGQTG